MGRDAWLARAPKTGSPDEMATSSGAMIMPLPPTKAGLRVSPVVTHFKALFSGVTRFRIANDPDLPISFHPSGLLLFNYCRTQNRPHPPVW